MNITTSCDASTAIVRAARCNSFITPASLRDDLERGDIDGWSVLVHLYRLNFSQWSGAMERAITVLEADRV